MTDLTQVDSIISETLEEGWEFFTKNITLLVIAGLVHSLVTVLSLGLCAGPITLGLVDLIRKRRQGEEVEVSEVFSGFSHFGKSFLASLLMMTMIGIGMLLLVIPGVVLMMGWIFTFQVMAYQQTGATESMGRSWLFLRQQPFLVIALSLLALVLNSLGSAVLFGTVLTMPFSLVCLCIAFEKLTIQSLPNSPE